MHKNLYKKLLTASCLSLVMASNANATDDLDEMMKMSLTDIMNIEVTSVSKRAEKASEAAAAISVITSEDIRRSGANSIPELLRGVPGIQVSRINAGAWAVTSRGNADNFGNKLLVLIDGRSIYNPLFSGVLWEEQSTPLEDIDRIEVIRGPGSTLWGANAVNGVINIITKNSKDTQGNVVTAGIGSFDRDLGFARHGGKIDDNTTYRAYVNQYNQDNSVTNNGAAAFDEWNMTRSGVRVDSKLSADDSLTFSSDVYNGERNIPFTKVPTISVSGIKSDTDTHEIYGGNAIAKLSKKISDKSSIDLQGYYDFVGRDAEIFGHKIHTLDLDGQHSIELSNSNQFMWGAGYRLIHDDIDTSNIARYQPRDESITTQLFSAFAQDKIELSPKELYLTLGSKFEHNDFTGFEVQPNARLAWTPDETNTVWGSVTRAVRTPSQNENYLTQMVQGTAGGYVALQSNQTLKSEELIAYEIGYRTQPLKDVSIDATAFVNDYNNIRSFELSGGIAPDVLATLVEKNKGKGISKGFELGSTWQATDKWQLKGSYSYLDMDIKMDSDSSDTISKAEDGRSPDNMFSLNSHYSIDNDWELDQALYYVGAIDGSASDKHSVNAYLKLDAKVTYRPTEGVETSLIGQNLLDNRHQEFGSMVYSDAYQIPRSVFGKVTVRF